MPDRLPKYMPGRMPEYICQVECQAARQNVR